MTLAYRIFVTQYETDAQFRRLLALLRRHRRGVDEVCLFTDYWHHGYTAPSRFARLARIMARRVGQLREAGIPSVGINVLDTIGHTNEAWDFLPPLPFPVMVGHDGSRSRSCACPVSPAFRQYVRARYEAVARARPDFIWVDDDIRMQHHGVAFGCFCARCLAAFRAETGFRFRDRADLVVRLNAPRGGSLRTAWVEHNISLLTSLMADIESAVHAVDPAIDLGLMTAGTFWSSYSGCGFKPWIGALRGTRARPGGGFYDDRQPLGMVHKAFEIGSQCSEYPEPVRDVQYELENFPYQKLAKSEQTVLNECALALGYGCNGIAFNALKDLPGSLADYDGLLAAIVKERPAWDAWAQSVGRCRVAGLWPASHPQWASRRPVRDGNWFAFPSCYAPGTVLPLLEIGLPVTPDRGASCGTILAGRTAELFADDELKAMLSGGVLLDPPTLDLLWERGLGELAGVRSVRSLDNGVWEQLTRHPLNGRHAGSSRDARVSFWTADARVLRPVARGVQDLAHLVGYDNSDLGPCMTAYENRLGGRVVTLGYAPWTRLENSAKRDQMIRLAGWAARGLLPAGVEETVRVIPVVRVDSDGRARGVVLLNASFDATGPFHLRLARAGTGWRMWKRPGWRSLRARRSGRGCVVTVPGLDPWSQTVLLPA